MAQESVNLTIARQQVMDKQYDAAQKMYAQLYDTRPFDKSLYKEYLDVLLELKLYDEANILIDRMILIRRQDVSLLVDKGVVWKLQNPKKAKQNPYFEEVYTKVVADEYATRQLADALVRANEYEWAIKVLEKVGNNIYNMPTFFSKELAVLYGQMGNTDKAINATLDIIEGNVRQLNEVKESLLTLIKDDDKKYQYTLKQLDNRIQANSNSVAGFVLLKVWMYTFKNNYQGALEIIIDYDKMMDNSGNQVLGFVKMATEESQYDIAIEGTKYIMSLGRSSFVFEKANEDNLLLRYEQLKRAVGNTTELINPLQQDFKTFFTTFPEYYGAPIIRSYAQFVAYYLHQVDTAIHILEASLQAPNNSRENKAWSKIDLGDYYLLKGAIWDATLIYSQVEKDFKQDFIGEQARFRNAQLAYFNQDFEWAQAQLKVLKAATSDLIANDALNLSLLITENVAPMDTAKTLLKQYAQADLFVFQNKLTQADSILSVIQDAEKDAPIIDNVLKLRAEIALKQNNPKLAISYLQALLEAFADEVLADDALFMMATIYEQQLKDKKNAALYYEKIITDYAGSTFLQQARIRYAALQNASKSL